MSLSEAEQIAARITAALPRIKRGTLRFWGEWFGRPYDNIHEVIASNAEHDVLRILFNEGEVLYLWSPHRATVDDRTFKIQDASRLRWEWFAYGSPKTEQNRYFEDFIKIQDRIDASTNVDWAPLILQPTVKAPALEIV